MSKETELSDEQIDCCVGNLGMAENSILAGPDEIRRAMRAAIAADRELRLGNVMMPVIAYAYDDPEYGFAGSPCKRFSGTPPGRAQNSEALVRLSDAQAALAAQAVELHRAARALMRAGYVYIEGAEEWKPPIGPSSAPLLDKLAAQAMEIEGLRKDAEKTKGACNG